MEVTYKIDLTYSSATPQPEASQTWCCRDLEIEKSRIEFYPGRQEVNLLGPEEEDSSIDYTIKFCPYCGEAFTFREVGKFKRLFTNRKVINIVRDEVIVDIEE